MKLGAAALVSALGVSAAVFLRGDESPSSNVARSVPTVTAVAPPAQTVDTPAGQPAAVSIPTPLPSSAMLPDRLLDCTLGRIANFDPTRSQTRSELKLEGKHSFELYLPSIPARTAPPPPATRKPEPVDPRTRIVADPDGLAREAAGRSFQRVVDFWPERVEMTVRINEVAVKLFVVDEIDPSRGTATLFLTSANDAVTFDLKNLYLGNCKVRMGAAAKSLASS